MEGKPTRADLNGRIERVSIRGRRYATVDARVLAFWELYPDGSIETEMLSDDGDRCVFKATAYDMDAPIATGHAFEIRTASAVNKTSYIENCETSAVGRALGFLGIGSNGSIASADEVEAAIGQQEAQEAPDDGRTAEGRGKGRKAPQRPSRGRFEVLTVLNQQALDMGIKQEGISSWMDANIGPDRRVYTDEQIRECEDHIRQLIADKENLAQLHDDMEAMGR